jgi:hypothetical protein
MNKKSVLTLVTAFSISFYSIYSFAADTTIAKYLDNRKAAMALNYDTELYMIMIHSGAGYYPETAATRAQRTLDGWPNIITDCETHGIPVSFNICGYEAVFGDWQKRSQRNRYIPLLAC